ncbi:hypothetical protein GCM10007108_10330 [Thermogymnomonas acidicola]|uniref:Tetratricopeptide repeat protein n=1 Tax=Thermogymnomonas acidicola TaxID=399579 RepID=A0AA37F9M8_9ARCH|nr:hypothetical protein [Thermogymnomonas acidicola]GGM74323.1 hypothetical protein GCM10007108_10330 [Thermogymnomonas acidicola]
MENELEALLNSGDLNLQKEKYMDAVRDYTKAYEIVGDSDEQMKADICYRLSQAYLSLERRNPENSLKFAKEALSIHERLGDEEMVVMDLLNIGYISFEGGRKEESESYYRRAIEISDRREDPLLLCMSLNAMADFMVEARNDPDGADRIYSRVMQIAEQTSDWENYFEAYRGRIEVLRKKGKEEEALKMAMEAIDRIDDVLGKIKNKKERRELRKGLSYIYDVASDIAMEMEDVDNAIRIAQRMKDED